MTAVIVGVVVWLFCGAVIAIVQRRRGHNLMPWIALSFLGPLLAVLAFDVKARERHGLLRTLQQGKPTASAGLALLVGVGPRGEPDTVVEGALGLLDYNVARLGLATVVDQEVIRSPDAYSDDEAAAGRLRELASRFTAHQPEVMLLAGDPAVELASYAAKSGYDAVAVGPNEGGLGRAVVGSVTAELVRRGDIPVLVCPPNRQTVVNAARSDR